MALEPRDTWRARWRSRAFARGKVNLKKGAQRRMARALFDRERRVIMDFNAKAGCTVAVKMFFRQMGLLEEALAFDNWIHRYRRQVFAERHPTAARDLLSRNNVLFKVVRNPFPRAVSSLRNKVRTGKGIHKILEALNLQRIEDITFRQFVGYLESTNLRENCDSHYRHQVRDYELLGFRQPFVCKLENLEADIARLNERFGFAFDPAGLTSEHHAEFDRENAAFAADTPWGDFGDSPGLPDYRHFYDSDLAARAARLYRPDLDAYRYEFPWPEIL